MLKRCLETLALLEPKPTEVIVVVGDEFQGEPPQQVNGLSVRVIYRGPGLFDFSLAVNCGVLACRGDLVLILNDDIEAESSDWLGRMAAHLDDPTIGAVGATLLYPDRSIQHIGIEFDQDRNSCIPRPSKDHVLERFRTRAENARSGISHGPSRYIMPSVRPVLRQAATVPRIRHLDIGGTAQGLD